MLIDETGASAPAKTAKKPKIILPNQWRPRHYQIPVLQYLEGGGTRAVTVWARRHGKDNTAINYTACAAIQRVGLYWHVLPTLRQARKAVWNGIDRHGRRIIDQALPLEIRKRTRDDDMLIELVNGSMYQVVGADNHDALVGANPVGVILSEWSLMDPKVWDFIRPILMENGGWAWFIYTPRGRNHGHSLYEMAKGNPSWFAEVVDIETAGVLDTAKVLAEERASGMPEEMIRQEYFCDFDIGVVGSIFAKEMERAEANGRITDVPYDPNFPVETSWDLGVRDKTAIWFIQRVGMTVRCIDYFEDSGQGLAHYVGLLNSKPYHYNRHIAPFDINVQELGSGKSRKEIAEQLGVMFDVAPKLKRDDSINAARALISKTWFDKNRCADGIKALKNYKRDWDEELNTFSKDPIHDWSSHGSSAFYHYAVMPELDYVMPQWLKDMSPVFGGRVPNDKLWRPKQDLVTAPKKDPLAQFRG